MHRVLIPSIIVLFVLAGVLAFAQVGDDLLTPVVGPEGKEIIGAGDPPVVALKGQDSGGETFEAEQVVTDLDVKAKSVALFTDPDRVAQAMDERPKEVVRILESILTPGQMRELERLLFPEPPPAVKLERLREAETILKRAGLEATDQAIVAVTEKRIAVEALVPAEDSR